MLRDRCRLVRRNGTCIGSRVFRPSSLCDPDTRATVAQRRCFARLDRVSHKWQLLERTPSHWKAMSRRALTLYVGVMWRLGGDTCSAWCTSPCGAHVVDISSLGWFSMGWMCHGPWRFDVDVTLRVCLQLECPAGFWCGGDGQRNRCPTGRYGNVSGLQTDSCSGTCDAGYLCPAGSTHPRVQPIVTSFNATNLGQSTGSVEPSIGLSVLNLGPHAIPSGSLLNPAVVIQSNPPSSLDITCEIKPPSGSLGTVVVTDGAAVIRSSTVLPLLTVSAQPGSTVDLQLVCTLDGFTVTTPLQVSMLPCTAGQVQPPGTLVCTTCQAHTYSWIPGARISSDCLPCPAGGACVCVRANCGSVRVSPAYYHVCSQLDVTEGPP